MCYIGKFNINIEISGMLKKIRSAESKTLYFLMESTKFSFAECFITNKQHKLTVTCSNRLDEYLSIDIHFHWHSYLI